MATRRSRRGADGQPTPDMTEKVIAADATDEEQSSDDEAPEEVSAAAATALAGRRRKAEHQARQAAAAPKRKRARTSSSSKAVDDGGGGKKASSGEGEPADGLELPSDLLLRVKSGGLQRLEADVLEAEEQAAAAAAAAATAPGGRRKARAKAGDASRSDNFRLVVLDEDDGGVDADAESKAHAAESAKNFLRDRMGSRKRVSHSLFKARKRLGPSPNF
ncbi:unnamed protein product [Ectocarpus sp. 4 AP-2014]